MPSHVFRYPNMQSEPDSIGAMGLANWMTRKSRVQPFKISTNEKPTHTHSHTKKQPWNSSRGNRPPADMCLREKPFQWREHNNQLIFSDFSRRMAFDYKVVSSNGGDRRAWAIHKLNWIRGKRPAIIRLRTHIGHSLARTPHYMIFVIICTQVPGEIEAWRIFFHHSSHRRSQNSQLCVRRGQTVDFSKTATTHTRRTMRYWKWNLLKRNEMSSANKKRPENFRYLYSMLCVALFLASKTFILFALRNFFFGSFFLAVVILSFANQCVIYGLPTHTHTPIASAPEFGQIVKIEMMFDGGQIHINNNK